MVAWPPPRQSQSRQSHRPRPLATHFSDKSKVPFHTKTYRPLSNPGLLKATKGKILIKCHKWQRYFIPVYNSFHNFVILKHFAWNVQKYTFWCDGRPNISASCPSDWWVSRQLFPAWREHRRSSRGSQRSRSSDGFSSSMGVASAFSLKFGPNVAQW